MPSNILQSQDIFDEDRLLFKKQCKYIGSIAVTQLTKSERQRFVNEKLHEMKEVGKGVPIVIVITEEGVKTFKEDGTSVKMAHGITRLAFTTSQPDNKLFAYVAKSMTVNKTIIIQAHMFKTKKISHVQQLSLHFSKAFQIAYAKNTVRRANRVTLFEKEASEVQAPMQNTSRGKRWAKLEMSKGHDNAGHARKAQGKVGPSEISEFIHDLENSNQSKASNDTTGKIPANSPMAHRPRMLLPSEIEAEVVVHHSSKHNRPKSEHLSRVSENISPKLNQQRKPVQRSASSLERENKEDISNQHRKYASTSEIESSSSYLSPIEIQIEGVINNPQKCAPEFKPIPKKRPPKILPIKNKSEVDSPKANRKTVTPPSTPYELVFNENDKRKISSEQNIDNNNDIIHLTKDLPSQSSGDFIHLTKDLPTQNSAKGVEFATPAYRFSDAFNEDALNDELEEKTPDYQNIINEKVGYTIIDDVFKVENKNALPVKEISMTQNKNDKKESKSETDEDEDDFETYDNSLMSVYAMTEDEILKTSKWFQPGFSREIAEELLQDRSVGSFFIRESLTHKGCFVMVLKVPETYKTTKVANFLIERLHDDHLKIKGFDHRFRLVTDLIAFYSSLKEDIPCQLLLDPEDPIYLRRLQIDQPDNGNPQLLVNNQTDEAFDEENYYEDIDYENLTSNDDIMKELLEMVSDN